LIKIIKTERIQDGVERIIFSVGEPALVHTQKIESELNNASQILKAPLDSLSKTVLKINDQLIDATKEIERLKTILAQKEAEELQREAITIEGLKIAIKVLDEIDQDYMIKICNFYVDNDPSSVVVVFGKNVTGRIVVKAGKHAIEKGVHAGEIASGIASIMGGGGSGDPNFGQGGGSNIAKISQAMEGVIHVVKSQISRR